jgi:hydroxyacylglutathione hydrolase
MSSKTASTVGFERRFNLALRATSEEAFVRALMTGIPAKPPTFDRIIARNRARALPPLGEPRALSAAQAREAIEKGAVVLDIRTAEEYGAGHVPGALNVWVDSPQFANRVALFVAADRPIVFVAGGPTDLAQAVQALGRVGLDDVAGYLQWGMGDWKSQGLAVSEVPQISVHDLATMREERPDLVVLDVREPLEWDEGHIEGAQHLPMGEAIRRRGEVPAGRPVAVICAGGLRSSLTISALVREGVGAAWFNVAGGMAAWTRAGYPSARGGGVPSPA